MIDKLVFRSLFRSSSAYDTNTACPRYHRPWGLREGGLSKIDHNRRSKRGEGARGRSTPNRYLGNHERTTRGISWHGGLTCTPISPGALHLCFGDRKLILGSRVLVRPAVPGSCRGERGKGRGIRLAPGDLDLSLGWGREDILAPALAFLRGDLIVSDRME